MIKYFRLKGRINRIELFTMTLILCLLESTLFISLDEKSTGFVTSTCIVLIFYLIQCAKRYHDLNKWGINGFVWFIIPFANIFYFIQLYFIKGTSGANKYGEESNLSFKKKSKTLFANQESNMKAELVLNKSEHIDSNIYKVQNDGTLSLSDWLINEGDCIENGQPIFEINSYHGYAKVPCPEQGYIEILFKSGSDKKFDSNDILFAIYQNDDDRIKKRYSNKISFDVDDFTKEIKMCWQKIAAPSNNVKDYYENIYEPLLKHPLVIRLTSNFDFFVQNISGKDYLTFEYHLPDLKLNTDDKVLFLMENGTILEFILIGKPYIKVKNSVKGFNIPIFHEELFTLSKYKVDKIRIEFIHEQYKIDIEKPHDSFSWYPSKKDLQYVIQSVFIDYLKVVSENVKDYSPLFKSAGSNVVESENDIEKCFVYLMIDTTNDFHKIGISNNPLYRERTLQSEKPTIELIASKEFPNRQIAESIEKALHNTYRDKNIRGEWFNFTKQDINDIKETLK